MLQNGYNPDEFLVRFFYRPIMKDKILISNLHIWLRTKTKHRNLAIENLQETLARFWRNVVSKQKPNVQIHATTTSLIISNFETSG